MHRSPTVAIVGRPNVGKSTLFNRLIGKRYAITSEIAGTTRDRVSKWWDCNGFNVFLVDTGGLESGETKGNIEEDIQTQAKIAIDSADLIIFITDIAQGLTPDDFMAADILRKSRKPVILVANKCDNPTLEEQIYNIYELGFGEPIAISAIHETGVEKLQSTTEKLLKELKFSKQTSISPKNTDEINICILGRPNTGKSSLVNALTGETKNIVSDIAGTTRDSLDSEITFEDKKYTLIDTAGLRRRGKIEKGIEKFGALRVLNAIERAEIVTLLIDGTQPISKQDCNIAQIALEKNKGLILVINKIDLFEEKEEERNRIVSALRRRFDFIPWAPVIFISAKTKENTTEILKIARKISTERSKRVPTPKLNLFLQKTTYKHSPSSHNLRKPKFMYATQAAQMPPTFIIFFKNAKNLHFSYPRYLENEIRKEYGFEGTSIVLKFKENNPKEDLKR